MNFIRAALNRLKQAFFEPQCSNATDSEAQRSACAEELEHAAKEKTCKMKLYDNAMLAAPFMEYLPFDCNNSPAMTRELPLSDESKQWIAKDTCSGREIAAVKMVHAMHTPMFPVASEYVIDSIAFDEQDEMSDGIRQLITHQQKMMEQSLKESIGKSVFSESTDHV